MPRNVRNFWIEADIDGRASQFASGPVSKDGGFALRIRMRDQGKIETPIWITGHADTETGELTLHVGDGKGKNYKTITTKRNAPKPTRRA